MFLRKSIIYLCRHSHCGHECHEIGTQCMNSEIAVLIGCWLFDFESRLSVCWFCFSCFVHNFMPRNHGFIEASPLTAMWCRNTYVTHFLTLCASEISTFGSFSSYFQNTFESLPLPLQLMSFPVVVAPVSKKHKFNDDNDTLKVGSPVQHLTQTGLDSTVGVVRYIGTTTPPLRTRTVFVCWPGSNDWIAHSQTDLVDVTPAPEAEK